MIKTPGGIHQPIVAEDLERYRPHIKENLFDRRPSQSNKEEIQRLALLAQSNQSINELLKKTIMNEFEAGKSHFEKAEVLSRISKKFKQKKKRTLSMCGEKKYAKTLQEYQERVFNGSPVDKLQGKKSASKPVASIDKKNPFSKKKQSVPTLTSHYLQPNIVVPPRLVQHNSNYSSGTYLNVTNQQSSSLVSGTGLKATLNNVKMSEYLRQRINAILDKDDNNQTSAISLKSTGLKQSDQKFSDGQSKIMRSPVITPYAHEGITKLNLSTNSAVLVSPRIGEKGASDSIGHHSSRYTTQMHSNNKRELPEMFQFVITKPILTGELLYSDQTFGSVVQEPDSNQKVQFEFTPASTILQPIGSPTHLLSSPEDAKGVTPPKPFMIKLEESYKLTPSLQKETAQFIDNQITLENKETPKSGSKVLFKGKKLELSEKEIASPKSEYNLKIKPTTTEKGVQTSQIGCKSVSTQTVNSPIQQVNSQQTQHEEYSEVRTVRRTGDSSFVKSGISQIQDQQPSIPLTAHKIIEPVLTQSGIQNLYNSDLMPVTAWPGNTPAERQSIVSVKNNPSGLQENKPVEAAPISIQVDHKEKEKGEATDAKKIILLESPMKMQAERGNQSERSNSSIKNQGKKPQIMYDPKKVIPAKINSFRTSKTGKDQESGTSLSLNKEKDLQHSEPEVTNFLEKEMKMNPQILAQRYKKGTFTELPSANNSPQTRKTAAEPTNQKSGFQQYHKTQTDLDLNVGSPQSRKPYPSASTLGNLGNRGVNLNENSRRSDTKEHLDNQSGKAKSRVLYDLDLLNDEELNQLDSFGLSASGNASPMDDSTPDKTALKHTS